MENKTIITISREFGSGGRAIGKMIAERLGIPFYDKKLIEIAAAESGIDKELFEENAGETSKGFHWFTTLGYSLGSPLSSMAEITLTDRLFVVQAQVIEQVAEEGPCVIVGQCADYVLQDRKDVLNVFIHADMKDRKAKAKRSYDVDLRDVEQSIKKIDKHRANYYDYYTDRKWGRVQNYDISINSSTFGYEETATIIIDLAKRRSV